MEYLQLGKTDMNVSRIALGAWQFGSTDLGATSDEQAVRIIHHAIDHGINLIDYGMNMWGMPK